MAGFAGRVPRPLLQPQGDKERRDRAAKAFSNSFLSIKKDPNIPETGGQGERDRRKIGATGSPRTLLGGTR